MVGQVRVLLLQAQDCWGASSLPLPPPPPSLLSRLILEWGWKCTMPGPAGEMFSPGKEGFRYSTSPILILSTSFSQLSLKARSTSLSEVGLGFIFSPWVHLCCSEHKPKLQCHYFGSTRVVLLSLPPKIMCENGGRSISCLNSICVTAQSIPTFNDRMNYKRDLPLLLSPSLQRTKPVTVCGIHIKPFITIN